MVTLQYYEKDTGSENRSSEDLGHSIAAAASLNRARQYARTLFCAIWGFRATFGLISYFWCKL